MDILPLQPGFDGFCQEDVEELERLLGHQISEAFATELEEEISGWLTRFAGYWSLGYGSRERKLVASAQAAARKLRVSLEELGDLGDLGLEEVTYAQGVTNDEFKAVLASLDQFGAHIERQTGSEIDVVAVQIHAFRKAWKRHGLAVTISTKNTGTTFNPSLFARFIDAIWRIEPRLRVFQPGGINYWNSLSQWIGSQLRKPDPTSKVEKLILMGRQELGKRPK